MHEIRKILAEGREIELNFDGTKTFYIERVTSTITCQIDRKRDAEADVITLQFVGNDSFTGTIIALIGKKRGTSVLEVKYLIFELTRPMQCEASFCDYDQWERIWILPI